MAAIEDGMYQPAMKARMAELERERAEIAARLAEAPQSLPDVHPGIAELYKRKVARLTATLKDQDTRLDASSDIRSLVGKRSEARRVGKECVSTCRSRWTPYH